MMTSLKEIYNDIVSTYAQYEDIHSKLLSLNNKSHKTTTTKDICKDWMWRMSDDIQLKIKVFAEKLWKLPEVNGRNK